MRTALNCRTKSQRYPSGIMAVRTSGYVLAALNGMIVHQEEIMPNVHSLLIASISVMSVHFVL